MLKRYAHQQRQHDGRQNPAGTSQQLRAKIRAGNAQRAKRASLHCEQEDQLEEAAGLQAVRVLQRMCGMDVYVAETRVTRDGLPSGQVAHGLSGLAQHGHTRATASSLDL